VRKYDKRALQRRRATFWYGGKDCLRRERGEPANEGTTDQQAVKQTPVLSANKAKPNAVLGKTYDVDARQSTFFARKLAASGAGPRFAHCMTLASFGL
jgi:hypothetical protein